MRQHKKKCFQKIDRENLMDEGGSVQNHLDGDRSSRNAQSDQIFQERTEMHLDHHGCRDRCSMVSGFSQHFRWIFSLHLL